MAAQNLVQLKLAGLVLQALYQPAEEYAETAWSSLERSVMTVERIIHQTVLQIVWDQSQVTHAQLELQQLLLFVMKYVETESLPQLKLAMTIM